MPIEASKNHHPDTFRRRGGLDATSGKKAVEQLGSLPAIGSIIQFNYRSPDGNPIVANGYIFGHASGFHGGRGDGYASLDPHEPFAGVLVFGVSRIGLDPDLRPEPVFTSAEAENNQTFTYIHQNSIIRFWDDNNSTWWIYDKTDGLD